jgi:hypothetical protein
LCGITRIANESCSADNNITFGCTPDWQCNDWSDCSNGIATRECSDNNNCNDLSAMPNTESICASPGRGSSCNNIQVSCGEWDQCIYNNEVGKIFNGTISKVGIQKRECSDVNRCISNYFDQRSCNTTVFLDLARERDICDSSKYVIRAVDKNTGQAVADIDIVSWVNDGRINIRFIQNTSDCWHCQDGKLNEDEQDIDCGGKDCKSCAIRLSPGEKPFSWIWILWILVLGLTIWDLVIIGRRKNKFKNKEQILSIEGEVN